MHITKRQRDTLDYIDFINRNTKSELSLISHFTVGPRGRTVKMLDMRVVRALSRKGLIVLIYPGVSYPNCEFYPILTCDGHKLMDKLFTSKY